MGSGGALFLASYVPGEILGRVTSRPGRGSGHKTNK